MERYIVFIKNDESKAIQKVLVNAAVRYEMRSKGFRKYHSEVDAESEKEAIERINKNGQEYLAALQEFSGSVFICVVITVVMALIFLFRTWG